MNNAWYLAFAHRQSLSLSIETCERLMATFVGGPVRLTIGELSGNPRDFYARSITITGQRGELGVTLTTSQAMRGADDPEALITHVHVTLQSDTYATKLAAWRELQGAFLAIGCRDQTLEGGAAPILDDANAAGDETTASLLSEEITAALVAQARVTRSVGIRSPRVDIEPILSAYSEPERIVTFGLTDCGLRSLPASFARFPNLRHLSLEEDAFDGSVLCGVSLPKLESLRIAGKSLRRVTKDDLAGFPALEFLSCVDTPLEELDPDIIEVCPKLVRVYVEDTPLSRNDRAMAELRSRWPGMKWSYRDLSTRVPPVESSAAALPPPPLIAPPPAPPVVVVKQVEPAPRPSLAEGVLDLDAVKFSVEQIRELIATGDYRSAVAVRLNYTHIGDAVAELLATARAFPELVEVNLDESGVSDVGARALATQAVELDALEVLHLGDAPGSRDARGGVSDAAVEMLARSPRLPALRKITRSITHHVYSDGARDGQETITIERDDGRVVQSILSHVIWP